MKLTTRIATAGKLLIGQTKSALSSILLDSSTYGRNSTGEGFWLFGVGSTNQDVFISSIDKTSPQKAYMNCPPVSAIINKKVQCYVNGKTWIMNTSGKAKGKEATGEVATKIRKLLSHPNKINSGKDFDAKVYMHKQLYGYCVVLLNKPFGFPVYEAKDMWIIPNWMVEIEESKEMFFDKNVNVIKRVTVSYKGVNRDLPLDNVLILKDFRPSFESVVLPSSRICSLEMPINNVIGAFESRNVIINRRGPQTFVSRQGSDAFAAGPLLPDEKEDLLRDFGSKYGLTKSQSSVIIGAAGTTVQSVGYDVGQLKLLEEVTESAKAICDGFGYPSHLLGLLDPTFNNQNAAEKGLYQNSIIPEAESDCEQWNEIFKTADYGIYIEKDFSHISVLQQDKKELAGARLTMGQALEREFKNNWITLNRALEILGEDAVANGNKYYKDLLAEGYVFGNMPAQAAEPAQNN